MTFIKILYAVLIAMISISCNPSTNIIIQIEHSSESCFGDQKNKLTVYTENKVMYAKLSTNDTSIIIRKVDSSHIQLINSFIYDLRNADKNIFSTLVEEYKIQTGKGSERITNINGNSFTSLKEELFGGVNLNTQ